MVDLNDAPGPDDFKRDASGAFTDAIMYVVAIGITALLTLIGYFSVGRPLYGAYVRLTNVVSNADLDENPIDDSEVF